MEKNGKIDFTPDEIIATLKKTSLPTVLIEGRDDVIVYRKIEDLLNNSVNILGVGGRNTLISIFTRRSEYSNKKIIFIADKDLWSIFGVPKEFDEDEIIFTNGYSIENDVLVDINFFELMSSNEKTNFIEELEKYLKWYCISVSRIANDFSSNIKIDPNHLFDNNEIYDRQCSLNENEKFPDEIFEDIKNNYQLKVRGKSLMSLALRQLRRPQRDVKHSSRALLQIAAVNPGLNIKSIFEKVESALKN